MLILSRRLGEALNIHTPQGVVKITVMKIDNWDGLHKFGIEAPKEILILKEELKGKPLTFRKKHHLKKSDKPEDCN